ncbi:methyl-accepting chemotaxis protein [uncultured Pelagimonas sp.]|uniref:methyl-accepting chemotaxis protein n=1 Tax=uncultured Pelagimonas sp. TaxID=1618102 RepID=UPI0026298C11|nr:methyl-accepting chemotaxis protein [uncultured Pelagimonas sp.]
MTQAQKPAAKPFLSIKSALLAIVLFASAAMFGQIGLSEYANFTRAKMQADVQIGSALNEALNQLQISFLQARRAEKDFLLRRDLKYVERHTGIMEDVRRDLTTVEDLMFQLGEDQSNVEKLSQATDTYTNGFASLVASHQSLGLDENSGLQGRLRKAVKDVESSIKDNNHPGMHVKILMMRRHEKDFILRVDTKYKDRLDARVAEFQLFPFSMFESSGQHQEINNLVLTYQTSFAEFVTGTFQEQDLRRVLSNSFALTQPIFDEIRGFADTKISSISEAAMTSDQRFRRDALIVGGIGAIAFLIIAMLLSNAISGPLKRLSITLTKMMSGDFSEPLKQSRIIEISSITNAVEEFRAGEIQKAELTTELTTVIESCANGDFSKRISVSDKNVGFQELVEGVNAIGDVTERGLGDVLEVLQNIADGDLTQHMPSGHNGVFEDISSAVDNLTHNLRGMVAQLANSSQLLRTTSDKIASATEEASRRGEVNAASLEETAAALSTLDDSVRNSAEFSTHAKEFVVEAQNLAQNTVDIADRTIAAMARIEETSGKISGITNMIEEISFQTNLLALNANVEAARAGTAGKGFSVVALEVGQLAQQAADAVQDINNLIAESSAEITNGVNLVKETGAALQTIQGSVDKAADKVNEVSTSTGEQSVWLSELSTTVLKLDKDSQQNSAMLTNTSDAGHTLLSEASNLVQATKGFVIVSPTSPGEIDDAFRKSA